MTTSVRKLAELLPTIRRVTKGIHSIAVTEPQRSYLWEVDVAGREISGHFFDDLFLYAKSVNIPEQNIDVIQIQHAGHMIHYAGKEARSHQFQIEFWDDQNLTTYGYFLQWLNLMRQFETGRSVDLDSGGASDINIKLKDTTDFVNTGIITLTRCFPVSVGEVPLNYDSSDVFTFQVTFVYQDYEIQR